MFRENRHVYKPRSDQFIHHRRPSMRSCRVRTEPHINLILWTMKLDRTRPWGVQFTRPVHSSPLHSCWEQPERMRSQRWPQLTRKWEEPHEENKHQHWFLFFLLGEEQFVALEPVYHPEMMSSVVISGTRGGGCVLMNNQNKPLHNTLLLDSPLAAFSLVTLLLSYFRFR